jgi:uncharacterized membrane protein
MARRLRRNYSWLFLVLLLAWVLKTTTSMLQAKQGTAIPSLGEWFRNASIGYMPGWVVLIAVVSFYGWMLYIMVKHRETAGELAYGEVHV